MNPLAWLEADMARHMLVEIPLIVAAGVRVLYFDRTPADVYRDSGGYVITSELATDAAFAGELTAILGDAPRRAALAAQGLCRAREYSLSRMLGEYEDLLYELTEVHAGSAARV